MKLRDSYLLTSAIWFKQGMIKAETNLPNLLPPIIYVWLRQKGYKIYFQLNSENKNILQMKPLL